MSAWNPLDNGNSIVAEEFQILRAKCLSRRQLLKESARFSNDNDSISSIISEFRDERGLGNTRVDDELRNLRRKINGQGNRQGNRQRDREIKELRQIKELKQRDRRRNRRRNNYSSDGSSTSLNSFNHFGNFSFDSRGNKRYKAIIENDAFIIRNIHVLYERIYHRIKQIKNELSDKFAFDIYHHKHILIYEAHSKIVGIIMNVIRMYNNKLSLLDFIDVAESLKSRLENGHRIDYARFKLEYKLHNNFPSKLLQLLKKSLKYLVVQFANVETKLFDSFSFKERIRALKFELKLFGINIKRLPIDPAIKLLFRKYFDENASSMGNKKRDRGRWQSSYSSSRSSCGGNQGDGCGGNRNGAGCGRFCRGGESRGLSFVRKERRENKLRRGNYIPRRFAASLRNNAF